MTIQEHVSLKAKTTMRIGGTARYFAEITSKVEAEEATRFSQEKKIPLVILGSGSNTIFADGIIDAFVIRIKAENVETEGGMVTVEARKSLPVLINELTTQGLDLSPLTGIPGTVGAAIFGNAGQGAQGTWIDSFVDSVTAYINGEWKVLSKDECNFRYRESLFKDATLHPTPYTPPPIIWSATLNVPSRSSSEIQSDINNLLERRIETQPHLKTAGSCFKSLPSGTPAWKLIDEAGLRGTKIGGIEVSEKHANFLLNKGDATFKDVTDVVKTIQKEVPEIAGVEMRLIGKDGKNIEV